MKKRMTKLFTIVVTLVFVAIGILLGVLNPTPIQLDLFIFTPVLPLSIIMALMFIFGLFVGAVLLSLKVMKIRWQLAKTLKAHRKQSQQIIDLKKKLSETPQESASTPNFYSNPKLNPDSSHQLTAKVKE